MLTNTADFPIAGSADHDRIESMRRNAFMYVLIVLAMLCALRAMSLFVIPASRGGGLNIPTGTITDFAGRTSHAGLYRAQVIAAAVQIGEPQQWVVHVQQRNGGGVAHAAIQASVEMPETGIESGMRPRATYIGGGDYLLENVLFTRPGWWNVALVVSAGRGVDSLAFNARVP